MKDILESVSKSEGEKMIRNLLDMVVDTVVQESKVKAILVKQVNSFLHQLGYF